MRKPAAATQPAFAGQALSFDGMGNLALLSLLRSGRLQRKARVPPPSDPREHEADRVADDVMSADRPVPAGGTGQIDGARPLDEATRSLMESLFGQSFSDVRIHTGRNADDAAGALDSRAFTVGEDIVFGNAEFAPETTEGRRLLAHELAHVVQQRQTAGPMAGEKEAERDAIDAARQVSSGGKPRIRERAGPDTVQKDTRAASGTAAHDSGGPPTIVRIDAYWRSKSATATLSDGSKLPLTLTKNELEPGDTDHSFEYGADSGPADSQLVELACSTGTSCPILWTQPSSYALPPKVRVSIKLRPEESATRRLARLPEFIQDYLYKNVGGGNLEYLAKYGEDLVKAGATKADLAPIEVQDKAPPDPEFRFVQAAKKGRYSQFRSFPEFNADLLRKVAAAKEQARRTGLTPPDPFEGAEWQDDPAAAQQKWDKFVFAEYDKALKAEAAALRHVGEVASMAQNAWLQALGLSAALGTGGAGLEALGAWLSVPTLLEASTGVSYATWLSRFALFGLGTSFGSNLINRSKEGIAAGSNPVAVVNAAVLDTFGGKVVEKIRNKSNLTGQELNLSTEEQVTGGILDFLDGLMNVLGASESVKNPGVAETPIPRRSPPDPVGAAHDTPTLPAADSATPPAAATESPHAATSPDTAPPRTTTATGQTAPSTVPTVVKDVHPADPSLERLQPGVYKRVGPRGERQQPYALDQAGEASEGAVVDQAEPGDLAAHLPKGTPLVRPLKYPKLVDAFLKKYPKVHASFDSVNALDGLFTKTRSGAASTSRAPGGYLPKDTRAAAAELESIIELSERPDVERIELVPSTSEGRTSDKIVDFRQPDSSVARVRWEDRTLIGSSTEYEPRGGAGQKTADAGGIKAAIRDKVASTPKRPSQFDSPMADVPSGGTLAIHIQRPGPNVAQDVAGVMASLKTELGKTSVKEIDFFVPGQDELRRTVLRYVRQPNNDFVLTP